MHLRGKLFWWQCFYLAVTLMQMVVMIFVFASIRTVSAHQIRQEAQLVRSTCQGLFWAMYRTAGDYHVEEEPRRCIITLLTGTQLVFQWTTSGWLPMTEEKPL